MQGNASVYIKAVIGSAGMTQRNEDHSSSRNKVVSQCGMGKGVFKALYS